MKRDDFQPPKISKAEFVKSVNELVSNYIQDFFDFDANPQLRINPELLLVEIENGYAFQEDLGYSDEVIENAAYAEGDATESSDDFQAKQNYDYYPVKDFIERNADNQATVNTKAIDALATKYFK